MSTPTAEEVALTLKQIEALAGHLFPPCPTCGDGNGDYDDGCPQCWDDAGVLYPSMRDIAAAITAARAEGEQVGHARGVAEERERGRALAQREYDLADSLPYTEGPEHTAHVNGRKFVAAIIRDAIASGEKP